VFLTSIIPRLDDLAPVMVSEHGRGFWTVLDPSGMGWTPASVLAGGPGLAAFESPALAEVAAELLARYDPAYVPPPDLKGPFDATGDHLVVIFEGGAAYLYRLDGTEHATSPPLVLTPQCE
jgi:hypothetical protein